MRGLLTAAALATMLLASVAAAAPGSPTADVRATSGPVLALGADGDRAAFIVEGRFKECMSVMVWRPQRRRVDRLQSARACETNDRGGRTGPSAVGVRTASAVEVYDTRTGERAARLDVPGGVRLQDLDGGILVTASAGTVTLRRLGDGRTSTLRVGRTALAQLEPSGLFVAGARRVTFMPMRDVLRRLAA